MCSDASLKYVSLSCTYFKWTHLTNLVLQFSIKGLGITFSDNMSFNIHIKNTCNKDYLIINRLFRYFITNNYIFIRTLWTHIVRLLIESDSSIWNHDPL